MTALFFFFLKNTTELEMLKKKQRKTSQVLWGVGLIRTDVIKTGKSVSEEVLAPCFQTAEGKNKREMQGRRCARSSPSGSGGTRL